MAQAMLFIDGTWLYCNRCKLEEDYGKALHIDYGLLPKVLAEKAADALGTKEVDIVRRILFGSIPVRYDKLDEEAVNAQRDFYTAVRSECHYDIEVYDTDFAGKRLLKTDRDPNDDFEPKEKCVDVALATSMLYYAMLPRVYDVAIAVVGDRDYLPALQAVRQLGKRVMIASVRDCCAGEYWDLEHPAYINDTGIVWLNDLIPEIELRYERQLLECTTCHRKVYATFRPTARRPFYCEECRDAHKRARFGGPREMSASANAVAPAAPATPAGAVDPAPPAAPAAPPSPIVPAGPVIPLPNSANRLGPSVSLLGSIKQIRLNRPYNFISAVDGHDYVFYQQSLRDLEWYDLVEGVEVSFEIRRQPGERGRAGLADNVRIIGAP